MYVRGIILLSVAAVCFVLAWKIYKGNTELIHDYHRKRVKDKAGYGKAFGKALAVMGAGPLFGGILALVSNAESRSLWPEAVMYAGLIAGIVLILRVQKKYNQGLF